MTTTPYPFVASTVLTALQLNSTFNIPVSTKTANYVLTAADAGTRVVMNAAGATTITINTSIFSAGDNLQISNIGAGVTTVTAGTATVSSAGPLAIPQYGGGTLYFTSASAAIFFPSAGPAASSGLTFIASGTFGASAQNAILNCFSTTYTSYRVLFWDIQCSTTSAINVRLGSSNTPDTGSNYNNAFILIKSGSAAGNDAQSANNWKLLEDNSANTNLTLDIFQPFEAAKTFINCTIGGYSATYTGPVESLTTGFLNTTTSYTDFNLYATTGTNNIASKYAIYGYQKS